MRSRQEAQRSIQEAEAALGEEHKDGFGAIVLRAAVKRAAVKRAVAKAGPNKQCKSDMETSDSEESTASVLSSSDSNEEDMAPTARTSDGMCM